MLPTPHHQNQLSELRSSPALSEWNPDGAHEPHCLFLPMTSQQLALCGVEDDTSRNYASSVHQQNQTIVKPMMQSLENELLVKQLRNISNEESRRNSVPRNPRPFYRSQRLPVPWSPFNQKSQDVLAYCTTSSPIPMPEQQLQNVYRFNLLLSWNQDMNSYCAGQNMSQYVSMRGGYMERL